MNSKTITVVGATAGAIIVLLLARSAWQSKMTAFKLQQDLVATEAKVTNRFPDNLEFHVSFNHPTWKLQGLMPVDQKSNVVRFISRRGDEVVFTQVTLITNLATNAIVGTNVNETANPTNTTPAP